MYSNLKIVPLLIERETPCSLFSDESPKREKKESLFVREKTHFSMTLSLSLCVCSSSALFSLCGFRAFFLSLFFKSYIKERMERKMKRERRRAILPLCLNPTP